MREVVVLLGAEIEFNEAHERAMTFGGNVKLEKAFSDALERLSQHSFSAPWFAGNFHRLVRAGSPYCPFYNVEGARIFVQAFLDTRQNPEAIRRRLGLD